MVDSTHKQAMVPEGNRDTGSQDCGYDHVLVTGQVFSGMNGIYSLLEAAKTMGKHISEQCHIAALDEFCFLFYTAPQMGNPDSLLTVGKYGKAFDN